MKQYYLKAHRPVIDQKNHKLTGFKVVKVYVSEKIYKKWHHYQNKENYANKKMKKPERLSFDRLSTNQQNQFAHYKDTYPRLQEIEEKSDQTILAEKIMWAVDLLPKKQKRYFILHILQGISLEQIAKQEQKQEQAILRSIQRAKVSIMNYINTKC